MKIETRKCILTIIENIKEELDQIQKLLEDETEEIPQISQKFNWKEALNYEFNINQEGLEEGYRVSDEKVRGYISQIRVHLEDENPPENGETINLVLDYISEVLNQKRNRSFLKACAIITLLIERAGFTFGVLPEIPEIQQPWFQSFMKMRSIYKERIITYLTEDFDFARCCNGRFDIIQDNIQEGYGLNIGGVKNSLKIYKEHLEHYNIKNGLPLNLVIKHFNGNTSDRSNRKPVAILTLIMEHYGYSFGMMPNGVTDTDTKWFTEIEKMRSIYKERIVFY